MLSQEWQGQLAEYFECLKEAGWLPGKGVTVWDFPERKRNGYIGDVLDTGEMAEGSIGSQNRMFYSWR